MAAELHEMSAAEIVRLVARREVSATEVVASSLARIDVVDGDVNAICTRNPAALAQAEAIDRRLRDGRLPRPLEGVPFVVKDNLVTKGIRTTFGSEIYRDHIAEEDAVAVERIVAAGGIMIGKTNLPEFAHDVNSNNTIFGLTRNPLNLNVTAGGSSGGTGAAIAAGMAPIGLGTDLGGSIRIPSAFCGLSGIRPSPGRIPVYPTEYAWDTLVEHVHGPMARTVEDTGLLLSVLSGPDDRDPTSLPDQGYDYAAASRHDGGLAGRRAAYTADLGGLFPVDDEVRELTEAAARDFASLGCAVDEATFDASGLKEIIAGTRGFGMVARYADRLEVHRASMSSQLIGQVSDALQLDLRTVTRAERLRTEYYHRVRRFLADYDYILLPTVGAPAFRLDRPLPTEVGGKAVDRFYDVFFACYAFSIVGLPAMSVPCGLTREGLPVGLQIVGRRLREDRVLEAAASYAGLRQEHFVPRPLGTEPITAREMKVVTPGMRMS
ncbi:amidase [Enterovirga sp. CN4-39]|uniref:amidase n=1 Tax=Enterovirga sp. CN4-39 TaxID=3400910 RepID=UPI003C0D2477